MARPKGKTSAGQSKKRSSKTTSSVSTKKKKKEKASSSSSAPRGQSQSCHQCRQSIHSSKGVTEVKSGKERLKCSQCTRFWCQQCLKNRYGIDKDEMDPSSWVCPVCSKKCNCSLCRRKEGKLATGILTPLVKNAGFESVSEFLDKGTDDIAKVLQWKSPDSAVAKPTNDRRPSAATAKEEQSKAKRKRKRRNDYENSKSLANGTQSKSVTPVEEDCSSGSVTGSHGDGTSCRSNGPSCHSNHRPKRRKLTHPTYSITIDEDSLDTPPDLTKDKVQDDPTEARGREPSEPCTAKEEKESTQPDKPAGPVTPVKVDTRRRSSRVRGRRSTTEHSDPMPSPPDDGSVRRSPRKRKRTDRYISDDFRTERGSSNDQEYPQSDDDDIITTPLSPPSITPPSSNEQERDDSARENVREQLETLKASRMEVLRSNKASERRRVLEEKASKRDEVRRVKREERARALEVRKKEREAKKLSRIAAQEKLKLARDLLKGAQRDVKRRQKEREKQRKQEELRKLKEGKQNEKRRMQELTSIPVCSTREEVCLVDDSPSSCEGAGVPPLPDLPLLNLPLHSDLLPQFLFVSEFLYTFADALGLRRRLEGCGLCKLLSGRRGLGEVYVQLLKLVVDDESDERKDLKPSKSQRDLEQIARKYLHDNDRNGFISDARSEYSLEDSVVILHHLCLEALESMAICDHMTASCERSVALRKEQRAREREKSKQISEDLKALCERHGCSLEEVEAKRREFTSELREMKRTAECEQYECGLVMRNSLLGKDRHDRIYWKLQSMPGVMVETGGCEGNNWLVINSTRLLEDFMECLHPRGEREKLLKDSLSLHKASVAAGLEVSGVKKFYGN